MNIKQTKINAIKKVLEGLQLPKQVTVTAPKRNIPMGTAKDCWTTEFGQSIDYNYANEFTNYDQRR